MRNPVHHSVSPDYLTSHCGTTSMQQRMTAEQMFTLAGQLIATGLEMTRRDARAPERPAHGDEDDGA